MAVAVSGSFSADNGLAYKGIVTAIPTLNQFTIPTLARKGAGKFDGATNPYIAFVMRDAGGLGAAPQGETQVITAYDTVTGTFTTAAFTAPVTVGDEIIIVMGFAVGGGSGILDFWSLPQQVASITAAAVNIALPDIIVVGLPAGATVTKAIVMFKYRVIENTNAAVNDLNGASVALTSQVIQIRKNTPTAYVDAIDFVDEQFGLAATTIQGGDVLIGSIDVSALVGNGTYNLRFLQASADQNNLNFNDLQVGLRVWYTL